MKYEAAAAACKKLYESTCGAFKAVADVCDGPLQMRVHHFLAERSSFSGLLLVIIPLRPPHAVVGPRTPIASTLCPPPTAGGGGTPALQPL